MTPAEVARALAARSWWEWRVRMAVRPVLADGTVEDVIGTVDAVGDHLVTVEWPDVGARAHAKRGHLLPDLTDAATAGVLLEMLPRGWTLHDHGDEDGYEIREPMAYGTRTIGEGSTIGEAAARALLAARP